MSEIAPGTDSDDALVATIQTRLSLVADLTVAAVIDEVPSYRDALHGPMGDTIAEAVRLALAGFLELLGSGSDTDARTPLQPALEGAYALGRGEARSGRTMDALLAAYRVGARVAWREMASTAVAEGLAANRMVRFAELVFAYIDELSAASAAGHSDELATSGRVRQRLLERLGRQLLEGVAVEALRNTAQQAGWEPPDSLVAVIVPARQVRAVLTALDPQTLEVSLDHGRDDAAGDTVVLLVPVMGQAGREFLVRQLSGRRAAVGPSRPWPEVATSYQRAARVAELVTTPEGVLDSEEHLAAIVCAADAEALHDLRERVLAPLSDCRPGVAARLRETLRSWLVHQGRRDAVAAELNVHPQTVRYRMTQLRELFGDRLDDPQLIAELTIALATT